MLPSLDILICTMNREGLTRVSHMLLPPHEGIHYVVSVQGTVPLAESDEAQPLHRPDVTLTFLSGYGLVRNRNHALQHAQSDLLLIADDDERLSIAQLDQLRATMKEHPNVDIGLFRLTDPQGQYFKYYPPYSLPYKSALRLGYYVCSLEIVLRRRVTDTHLLFDERFGLGAPYLCAGEEDVLLHDALRRGLRILLFPHTIGSTDSHTTGTLFLTSPLVQRSKGATFSYCYGLPSALWRTLKEGLYHLLHHHVNPLPIFRNMVTGIRYERNSRTQRRNSRTQRRNRDTSQ